MTRMRSIVITAGVGLAIALCACGNGPPEVAAGGGGPAVGHGRRQRARHPGDQGHRQRRRPVQPGHAPSPAQARSSSGPWRRTASRTTSPSTPTPSSARRPRSAPATPGRSSSPCPGPTPTTAPSIHGMNGQLTVSQGSGSGSSGSSPSGASTSGVGEPVPLVRGTAAASPVAHDVHVAGEHPDLRPAWPRSSSAPSSSIPSAMPLTGPPPTSAVTALPEAGRVRASTRSRSASHPGGRQHAPAASASSGSSGGQQARRATGRWPTRSCRLTPGNAGGERRHAQVDAHADDHGRALARAPRAPPRRGSRRACARRRGRRWATSAGPRTADVDSIAARSARPAAMRHPAEVGWRTRTSSEASRDDPGGRRPRRAADDPGQTLHVGDAAETRLPRRPGPPRGPRPGCSWSRASARSRNPGNALRPARCQERAGRRCPRSHSRPHVNA